jgi:hypothetical protein
MLTTSPISGDEPSVYDTLLLEDFPGCVDKLAEDSAEFAKAARHVFSSCYFPAPVAVYWNPAEKRAGYSHGDAEFKDEYKVATAAVLSELLGTRHVEIEPLGEKNAQEYWVKVAYSPTLRTIGEILHYFPSKHLPTGGGRPLAAFVASSLLGTGLGYGAGTLYEAVAPDIMQTPGETRKRMARFGGLLGAGIGSIPAATNALVGRRLNDPTLFNHAADSPWQGRTAPSKFTEAIHKQAREKYADMGSLGEAGKPIELDELGRVVWTSKADATTRAMTMGAMYGASQMPDPNSQEGLITPHQVGLFGLATGIAGGGLKGYVAGRAVGATLGAITAMPQSTQDTLTRAGVMSGILTQTISKLYQ